MGAARSSLPPLPPGEGRGEGRTIAHEALPPLPPGEGRGEGRTIAHEALPPLPSGEGRGEGRTIAHEALPPLPPGEGRGEGRTIAHEALPPLPSGEGRGEGRTRSQIALLFLCVLFAPLLAAAPPAKKRVDLLVLDARVVTMDDSFSVFAPGGLAVARDAIVAVGPSRDIASRYSGRTIYRAGGRVILPGLVNTHTHAAMTLLRGLADDLPLDRWLTEHIFPAEAKNVSPDFVYRGTLLAALEMIQGGTTTFADMYYFESDAARAVHEAGLRAVLGETFLDFPVPAHKDLPETLAFMKAFVRRWKGHPRIVPAVAPHAPYTCSKETLLAARDFAHRERTPILIHVAETRKELEDAQKNWQQSPVLYLTSLGFFDPPPSGPRSAIVAAHAVWVSQEDRALLKRYGVAVSHNPESNMKLASGIAPVAEMAREGLLWSLGTDGPAGSNNDLSMFEAMDFAGKLAKVRTEDPTALPARDLVAAATRGGARALGLQEKIGSLEPGKRADFIAVDVTSPHVQPFEDLYSALVYSVKAGDVTDVWVEGHRLLADKRARTIDEAAVLGAAEHWRRRIRRSLTEERK